MKKNNLKSQCENLFFSNLIICIDLLGMEIRVSELKDLITFSQMINKLRR